MGELRARIAINLANMVSVADGRAQVAWDRLREAVHAGVRFLDDVIDVTRHPQAEIAEATRGNRKIGLGMMGFAECLILLGVAYDSEEATNWADRLMAFIATEARRASRRLAEERGVFPNWSQSIHAVAGEPQRNAALLSVAPTGTIGIIAGTSGGIEPLFALAYRREHTLGGEPLVEINPLLIRYAEQHQVDFPGLMDVILATGRLEDAWGLPEPIRRLFVTPPRCLCASISGSNMPSSATWTTPSPRPSISPTTPAARTSRRPISRAGVSDSKGSPCTDAGPEPARSSRSGWART